MRNLLLAHKKRVLSSKSILLLIGWHSIWLNHLWLDYSVYRRSFFFVFAVGQICNAFLAIVSTAACVCACVFASVHVSQLLAMKCQPPAVNATLVEWTNESQMNSTCLCVGGEGQNEIYTYDPLSCSEVLGILPIYLTTSAVTNGIASVVSSCYIILLWSNRFAYTYAGLKLSEYNANAPMPTLYQ